jgi:hypothetical protein
MPFNKHDALHVVERSAAHRKPAEPRHLCDAHIFGQRTVEPERDDLLARPHDLLGRHRAQAHRPDHEPIDQRVAGMRVPSLAENVFELLRAERVFALAARLQPEPAEDPIGGRVQHPDEREEHVVERHQRGGQPERHRLRVLDREHLWRLFAEYDVQKRDEDERDRERD